MATFLANEMNSTEGDITSPIAFVQTVFPLMDKKAGYLDWRHVF